MEHCLRWYGPEDPVSLRDVRQAGATGVVTALHHIPNGEAWPANEIGRRQQEVAEGSPDREGLRWTVVESVPVHEEIKFGGRRREQFIDNYRRTLENLGRAGIRTVCYNFMPVLDWTRTDLEHVWFDGSKALAFSLAHLVAFELYVLERQEALREYPEAVLDAARELYQGLERDERLKLARTVAAGLPGSEETYDPPELRKRLDDYASLRAEDIRENLFHFLAEVVPTAERFGVDLAIHPDDPPIPLLGLPRVVSTASDLEQILAAVDSPANGLTFCTGSLGARKDNQVEEMARAFAERTHFVHLRNIVRGEALSDFVEADHLTGDVDMVRVIEAVLQEEERRGRHLPMRPDHGHAMLDDLDKESRPGYSAIGRLRGLAELRGVEHALMAVKKRL